MDADTGSCSVKCRCMCPRGIRQTPTFKGLERPVIILTELGRMEDWQVEQMMYVAISRAKTYLVVIGDLPTQSPD